MKLTILGSGTSVPSVYRQPPAYLITADDTSLLVDIGSGATSSLARAGVSLDHLTGVFLSHLHLDHVNDLTAALFALANPAHPPRTKDFLLWGPQGTQKYLQSLDALYGKWVRPHDATLRVEDLKGGDVLQVGPIRCSAHTVQHKGHCLAYRFEHRGHSLCYSGDTEPCEGLAGAAADVDLLLCECSTPDEDPAPGHMSPLGLGRLASEAQCRRVLMIHLYDAMVKTDPHLKAKRVFHGEVELAQDGMVIEL